MKPPFVPSGVITLTTDFGHKGPFVATMKGMMLRHFAAAKIIDLTHEIVVHWPAEAAFWLKHAYRFFPPGTVHAAVVDPGVGTERDIIAGLYRGHAFIAPDNGQLAPILGSPEAEAIHRIDLEGLAAFGLDNPSATFHGRDIIAPIAAQLAAGTRSVRDLGPATRDIVPSWVDEPVATSGKISGVVITVDNFGNLFTNIDRPLIEALKRPVVHAGGHEIPLKRTYADVEPGSYLALINSFDVLEIARAEQSAARGLGLSRGAPVTVTAG